MLGKLIKYDLKALNRYLIIIHAFLLLSAALGRVLLTERINFESSEANTTLLSLAFLLYFMIFLAASFGTYIVIVVRFYKNLYSDEGYLTHTLPVTRGQLLLSKTITGSIWAIIDIVLIFLSGYILIATPLVTEGFRTHGTEVLEQLGFENIHSFYGMMAYLLFYFIFSVISGIISLYASVVLGQLFSGHRVLGAVVAYFGLSTAISVVSLVAMTITGLLTRTITDSFIESGGFNFHHYMMDLMNISGILIIVITVVLYIMTYLLMRRKTNLS